MRIIEGETSIAEEIAFPDISHIVDIIFAGYKTIVVALLGLGVALLFGYLILWTCGMRILMGTIRILFTTLRLSVLALIRVVMRAVTAAYGCVFRHSKIEHSDHVKLL